MEDKKFLASLGIPQDKLENPFAWKGWTVGIVRRSLAEVAKVLKTGTNEVLAQAIECQRSWQQKEIQDLKRRAKDLSCRVRACADRLRTKRMLPPQETLDCVTRYESHLSRQLLQALHELQRLQAQRQGAPIAPPAALDVTLDAVKPAS